MTDSTDGNGPEAVTEHEIGRRHEHGKRAGVGARAARRPVREAVWRGAAVVVLVVIWLGVAGVGGPKIGQLSSVTTNTQESFLPRGAESVKAQQALARFSDNQVLPALVVITGDNIYANALGKATTDGSAGKQGPPGAAYARSMIDHVDVDGRPLSDFVAGGRPPVVIGADDKSGVVVVVPLDQGKAEAKDAQGQAYVDAIVAAVRAQVPAWSGAQSVHVTGPAGFIADLVAAFAGIDGVLLLVACAAVLVILLIVYRAVALPLMVLLSAVSGLALAGGVVYLLANSGALVVSGQSQGILFILVVGAATDYGLLLVSRYREELTREASVWRAMVRAWRACLAPIAASAGTVTLGLLCLLAANLNSIRDLGPVGAIGIGGALLAAMTFLPAMLLLGRWVFWPRIPHVAAHRARQTSQPRRPRLGLWQRVARPVEAHPRRIGVIVALVLAAAAAFVPTFNASGTTQAETFLTHVDSVAGQQVLDSHYHAGAATPIQIVAPQSVAQRVADAAKQVPGVADVQVGSQVVDGMVVVSAQPTDPEHGEPVVTGVREAVHPLAPGKILVGGRAAIQLDTNNTAQRDLTVVIPLILVVVWLVLIALLRSLVAASLLTLATVLSFAATLGISAIVFNHIFDFPGADPSVPLFGFVFLVALGVDYSIFLLSRAREEVLRHGHRAGMVRALVTTGGVITSAGIVLAATFTALAVIPLLFLAQIAFIVAFGVLLDTFIVRSLLVPAAVLDLGRWAWWPGKAARPDIGSTTGADREAPQPTRTGPDE